MSSPCKTNVIRSELLHGHQLIMNLYNTCGVKTGLIQPFDDSAPLLCVVGNKNYNTYHTLNLRNITHRCGEWCMENLKPSYFSLNNVKTVDPTFRKSVSTKVFNLCGIDACEIIRGFSIRTPFIPGIEPYKFNCYGPGGFFGKHVDTLKNDVFMGNLIIIFNSGFTGGEIELPGHTIEFEKDFLNPKVIAKVVFLPIFSEHSVLPIKTGYRFSVVFTVSDYCGINDTTHPFAYLIPTSTQEFKSTLITTLNKFKKWVSGKKNIYISSWLINNTSILTMNPKPFKIMKVVGGKKNLMCCYEMSLNPSLESLNGDKKLHMSDICYSNRPINIDWNLVPSELGERSKDQSELSWSFKDYYGHKGNSPIEQIVKVKCQYGYLINPLDSDDDSDNNKYSEDRDQDFIQENEEIDNVFGHFEI